MCRNSHIDGTRGIDLGAASELPTVGVRASECDALCQKLFYGSRKVVSHSFNALVMGVSTVLEERGLYHC